MWKTVPAAESIAVGSAFRGWECGYAAAWWCNRACRPLMPGWLLEKGRSSWTSCWWRSMPRASTSEILCRWLGMGWFPGPWKHPAAPVLARCFVCSANGSWGMSFGGTQQHLWRRELQPVGVTGGGLNELWRSGCSSLWTTRTCTFRPHAFCVDPSPAECLVSFCPTCTSDHVDPLCCAEALASGDMRLEMPALRFGENTGRIIQHLVRQNLPLVQRGGRSGAGCSVAR